MARIELSQPTLSKIHEAIKAGELKITDDKRDLFIYIDYAKKNVIIRNLHTLQVLDHDAHSRRLIFKYFVG